jgi:exopolysaccharide biosynthesis protein
MTVYRKSILKVKERINDMLKKIGKIKFSWKWICWFLLFQMVFVGITSPFVIYYGPFNNLKKTLVATAMATFKHQYIATMFLSQERIDKILAVSAEPEQEPVESGQAPIQIEQNDTDVKLPTKHDDTIELYNIQGKKSKGYLLVVKDPTRVRVGFSSKLGVEGQKTSEIAKANNAIAAINGGSFTDRSTDGKIWAGTGAFPVGILMSDGKIIHSDLSSNDEKIYDTMAITNDGKLVVGPNSINELQAKGVRDAISFGPSIIINGKPQYNYSDQGINPRTAIAQRNDGAMLLLVMDGRQLGSVGTSLEEMKNIFMEHGAVNAINLDGGSSTTMYFNGEIINNPSDPYGERTIPTVVYVEP